MKYIKNYNSYRFDKINELIVNSFGDEYDGKTLVLFEKNVWIFDEEEYEDNAIWDKINKAYGKEIIFGDYDSVSNLSENVRFIVGEISGNTLYINEHGAGFRHSDHSKDLIKLEKEFGFKIVVNTFDPRTDDTMEYDLNPKDDKIEDRIFYHGTSIKYLNDILKFGLIPNSEKSNFREIEHNDKIFFTTNLDKAEFHAFHTAKETTSYPIVISFKVPDPSKLIIDYDLGEHAYGSDSELLNKLGYQYQYNKKGIDYKNDITNKIGIYGYIGRIPVSCIEDIWIDMTLIYEYTRETEYNEFDISNYIESFENIQSWSVIDKKDILGKLDNIRDEILEEGDYDNEDEDDY